MSTAEHLRACFTDARIQESEDCGQSFRDFKYDVLVQARRHIGTWHEALTKQCTCGVCLPLSEECLEVMEDIVKRRHLVRVQK